jgi:hypothetical protein
MSRARAPSPTQTRRAPCPEVGWLACPCEPRVFHFNPRQRPHSSARAPHAARHHLFALFHRSPARFRLAASRLASALVARICAVEVAYSRPDKGAPRGLVSAYDGRAGPLLCSVSRNKCAQVNVCRLGRPRAAATRTRLGRRRRRRGGAV